MTGGDDWHEREEFWAAVDPLIFSERRWAAAAEEIDGLLGLAGLSPGAEILDLCCGPGRHALELARRGFKVTGVDKTAGYLARAQNRAQAEGLSLELVQEDMRRFSRPEAFDAVINLFTSFGYFADPETDRLILRNIHRSLRRGGILVLEMMGREVLARIFRPRDWVEEGGVILLEERRVVDNWEWVDTRWIILKGDRRDEFNVKLRLFTADTLARLLDECGFAEVTAYGDLAGAPYDQGAKRLVAVARKG